MASGFTMEELKKQARNALQYSGEGMVVLVMHYDDWVYSGQPKALLVGNDIVPVNCQDGIEDAVYIRHVTTNAEPEGNQ